MVIATAQINEEKEAIGPIFFHFIVEISISTPFFPVFPPLDNIPIVNISTSIAANVSSSRLYLKIIDVDDLHSFYFWLGQMSNFVLFKVSI